MKSSRSLETNLIHSHMPRIAKAVTLPIFQSSTFEYNEDETSYDDIRYARLNNTPNHLALHDKLATLEGGESALVTSSGMSAISTTLMTLLSAGDHLLVQNCIYGGTHTLLVEDLKRFGISFDFVDPANPSEWINRINSRTKLFYVETLSNPLLQLPDFHAVVEFARANRLITVIDNTFGTPINFRPIEHGFDISIHSATKYLNGHSDIVAGAIIGRNSIISDITHKANHLGGTLDPHACFLLDRGLKTLAVRVRFQNEGTLKVARFLEQHPQIISVNYSGLESHPGHAIAQKYFSGHGGVLSFRIRGGQRASQQLIRALRLPVHAPSLGGVESLITCPATTTHRGLSESELARTGITLDLVRLSVGLEATQDLIQDLDQGLASLLA